MCLRLILALAGVVIITLAAVYVGYSQLVVLAIFLYTWTFALSALESPLETVLVANERFDYVTALSIIGQLGFAILGAIVLYSGQGFVVLVAVGLVAMMPQLALAVWAVKRRGLLAFKPAIDIRVWPHLMKSGLPFGFISLALTIAFSIDTVILSVYWPQNVVGWYSAAYGLTRSLLFFFDGFSTAIVPSLSRTYLSDARQVITGITGQSK